jgi:hypothetical protein
MALTDDDIFLALRRLPPLVFADLLGVIGTGRPMDPAIGQLAPYSGQRAAGEPGSGVLPDAQNERGGVTVDEHGAGAIRAFRRAGAHGVAGALMAAAYGAENALRRSLRELPALVRA